MRRGSADSIRASGQDPASTGRIQNCNLPSSSCQRRTLRTGRRPNKLHEDAEGRGRLSHGVRERGGRRGTPAALHRQLQRETPTLRTPILGSRCTNLETGRRRCSGGSMGHERALVIQSLKYKRAEIHGRIAAYEAQIAQARHDLAHVSATIQLFTEPEHQRARYMVSHGFFKKGRDRRRLRAPSRGGWGDDNSPAR